MTSLLDDLPIAIKILAAVGLAAIVAVVVGASSLGQLGQLRSGGTAIYANGLEPLSDVSEMRRAATKTRLDTFAREQAHTQAAFDDSDALMREDDAIVDRTVASYARRPKTAEQARAFATFRAQWKRYRTVRDGKLLAYARAGDWAAYDALRADTVKPIAKAAMDALDVLNASAARSARAQLDKMNATYGHARTLTVVLLLVGLALAISLGLLVAGRIRRAVSTLAARLETLRSNDVAGLSGGIAAMAEGDLTADAFATTEPIAVTARDEVGKAGAAVNGIIAETRSTLEGYDRTRASLAEMLRELAGTATSTAETSSQMAATSDEAGKAVAEIASAVGEVAQGAERQVRLIESVRASADQVAAAVTSSADTVVIATATAGEAREAAGEGVTAAEAATEAMQAVRDSSAQITGAIQDLAAKSEQIGAIVATITGIAEQTNLLALNAAIEAARAGEQGRGFAVVAEEVRKLAEDSQAATGEIATLIEAIQAETQRTVGYVEQGAERTEDGSRVVDRTRQAFLRIGTAVDDVTARVDEIAESAKRIAAGTAAVQSDVAEVAAVAEESAASSEQVSASTQETSASTQEVAASAQELAATADELQRLAARFRLAV